jgi:hypothetical protein
MLQLLSTPAEIQRYPSFSLSTFSRARVNGFPTSVTRNIFVCYIAILVQIIVLVSILHRRQPGVASAYSTSMYS